MARTQFSSANLTFWPCGTTTVAGDGNFTDLGHLETSAGPNGSMALPPRASIGLSSRRLNGRRSTWVPLVRRKTQSSVVIAYIHARLSKKASNFQARIINGSHSSTGFVHRNNLVRITASSSEIIRRSRFDPLQLNSEKCSSTSSIPCLGRISRRRWSYSARCSPR